MAHSMAAGVVSPGLRERYGLDCAVPSSYLALSGMSGAPSYVSPGFVVDLRVARRTTCVVFAPPVMDLVSQRQAAPSARSCGPDWTPTAVYVTSPTTPSQRKLLGPMVPPSRWASEPPSVVCSRSAWPGSRRRPRGVLEEHCSRTGHHRRGGRPFAAPDTTYDLPSPKIARLTHAG